MGAAILGQRLAKAYPPGDDRITCRAPEPTENLRPVAALAREVRLLFSTCNDKRGFQNGKNMLTGGDH